MKTTTIKWTSFGCVQQAMSNLSVREYLLRREPEIKRAAGRRHVGAGLGFRQNKALVSAAEQQMIRDGEDSRLLRALKANGCHPQHCNGRDK